MSVEQEQSKNSTFRVSIDGVTYNINPHSKEGDNNHDVSRLVMLSIKQLRSELDTLEGKKVFAHHGTRRKKSEVRIITPQITLKRQIINRHIDVLQGREEGCISFIKSNLQGSGEIVGLKVCDDNHEFVREIRGKHQRNILPRNAGKL